MADVLSMGDPWGTEFSLCTLARSVALQGGLLNVVGLSTEAQEEVATGAEPFSWKKLNLARTVLARVAEDDIVAFVDAHDVMMQRPLKALGDAYCEAQQEFQALAAGEADWGWRSERVIFAGEKNCFPWRYTAVSEVPAEGSEAKEDPVHVSFKRERQDYLPDRVFDVAGSRVYGRDFCEHYNRFFEGEHRFLNLGGYMGRAGTVLALLQEVEGYMRSGVTFDQAAFSLAVVNRQDLATVDSHARLFFSMHGAIKQQDEGAQEFPEGCLCDGSYVRPSGDVRPLRPSYRWGVPIQRSPAFLHFNGNGKIWYKRCAWRLLVARARAPIDVAFEQVAEAEYEDREVLLGLTTYSGVAETAAEHRGRSRLRNLTSAGDILASQCVFANIDEDRLVKAPFEDNEYRPGGECR